MYLIFQVTQKEKKNIFFHNNFPFSVSLKTMNTYLIDKNYYIRLLNVIALQ